MKRVACILLLMMSFLMLKAQTKKDFVKSSFIFKGDTLPVRILYPAGFDPSKKYPVILFLHGRGESGNDNEKQLLHGSGQFLDPGFRAENPAIVVFPQCSSGSYWSNVRIDTDAKGKRHFNFQKGGMPTQAMKLLLAYLNVLKDLEYADRERFYVGGLSMGGMGTYELLRRRPGTFAAAFAVCGGDNIKNVKNYDHVPLWLFHGGKDDIVDPAFTQRIADELKNRGADFKLKIYPDANHNSWDPAFAEWELLPWLFSKKK